MNPSEVHQAHWETVNNKLRANVYVDDSKSNLSIYDKIIGRDLMEIILSLDLLVSEDIMKWDHATVPMQDNSRFLEPSLHSSGMKLSSMIQ